MHMEFIRLIKWSKIPLLLRTCSNRKWFIYLFGILWLHSSIKSFWIDRQDRIVPRVTSMVLTRFSQSASQSWRSFKRVRDRTGGINIEMNWFPSHYLRAAFAVRQVSIYLNNEILYTQWVLDWLGCRLSFPPCCLIHGKFLCVLSVWESYNQSRLVSRSMLTNMTILGAETI